MNSGYTLSTSAKEENFKQVIRLRKNGYYHKKITGLVGIDFESIGKWYRVLILPINKGHTTKRLVVPQAPQG